MYKLLYVPANLFLQLEHERPKIYSQAVWKYLHVPEPLRDLELQNKHTEVESHHLFKELNVRHQVYMDQVEFVKPSFTCPVIHQIKCKHPVIGEWIDFPEPFICNVIIRLCLILLMLLFYVALQLPQVLIVFPAVVLKRK